MVVLNRAAKPRERNLVGIVQLTKQPAEAIFGLFDAVALHGARAVDQHLDGGGVFFINVSGAVHPTSEYCGFFRASRVMRGYGKVHIAQSVNH